MMLNQQPDRPALMAEPAVADLALAAVGSHRREVLDRRRGGGSGRSVDRGSLSRAATRCRVTPNISAIRPLAIAEVGVPYRPRVGRSKVTGTVHGTLVPSPTCGACSVTFDLVALPRGDQVLRELGSVDVASGRAMAVIRYELAASA